MTRADPLAVGTAPLPRPRRVVAVARWAIAGFGLVAIVATFADTAGRSEINPFNFFGYFTMQSNIIIALVLAYAGAVAWQGRRPSALGDLVRACATTYIVIVGIVYNTLLTGVDGGVALVWANWALHIGVPILAALDWTFVDDRGPVAWRGLVAMLIYPAIWCAVVLARGATDGWVPYPFLDPSTGYASVAIHIVGICAATLLIGTIVIALSRRPRAAITKLTAEAT